jgi:Na+/H+-dicarboxylate symporter
LVFVSLACGASNLSDGSSLGRIGIKTIGLYLFTTAVAITLALTVANIVDPGVGMALATDAVFVPKESPPLKDVIVAIVPTNPVKAMAEGNMLQVIVFAILVGVAIAKSGPSGQRVRESLNDWNDIIMKLIMMLMSIAPIGVFCLMLALFSNMGFSAITDLIRYFLTVAGVLVLHFLQTLIPLCSTVTFIL